MSIVDDNGVAEFPTDLKILIVDDDITCLLVLERMLRKLSYKVTKCQHARDALALLREDKNRFDVVISDLHMPDIDGLKLTEIIDSEMDLPVVIMSSDDRQRVIMNGVMKGACDYLVKPVRMEAVSLIWQHVVRKNRRSFEEFQRSGIGNININVNNRLSLEASNGIVPITDKKSLQDSKQRSEEAFNEGESSNEATTLKKPRVVWTPELHEVFVDVVNQLGHGNDVPKKILERMHAMKFTHLTRANIASHLQKYRIHRQKESARSASNRDVNACQQFQRTHTSSYQLPQQNLGNGHVLSTVPNHVDTGSNMFNSNIISESSHCIQTDASFYGLPQSNLIYQNDFPGSDGVAISNEENLHSNAGRSITVLSNPFSAADELIYEPLFLQEEVAPVGLQSNMGGYLSSRSTALV